MAARACLKSHPQPSFGIPCLDLTGLGIACIAWRLPLGSGFRLTGFLDFVLVNFRCGAFSGFRAAGIASVLILSQMTCLVNRLVGPAGELPASAFRSSFQFILQKVDTGIER